MSFTKDDRDNLRDAIQILLYCASYPPATAEEESELSDAWKIIEQLATPQIPIPGEDSPAWSFRLRRAAWEALCYAKGPQNAVFPKKALQDLRECQDTLRVIRIEERTAPSDPSSMLGDLLSEASLRRRQEAEARRIDTEQARRLSEHRALRERLADAFDRAYVFPSEENQQRRKPSLDGFQRWAERFLAVGTIMRQCDEAIAGLRLLERLRTVAGRPAPAAMKYACALLLLASQGNADAVVSYLEKANSDPQLRRFVLWLPFILDSLWTPFRDERGHFRFAVPPDETTAEEWKQAGQAFGWRPDGLAADEDSAIETPACPTAPNDTLPTVWYHGGRSYSADGQTHSLVSPEQHNALSAFLDCDQSLDTKALEKKGISNVSSVMQKLAKRFGDAVRTPKNKGEGYFIRVRTVRQDTPTE
jgi:hypothetical protein